MTDATTIVATATAVAAAAAAAATSGNSAKYVLHAAVPMCKLTDVRNVASSFETSVHYHHLTVLSM